MDYTARELVEWIRASLRSLSVSPEYGSLASAMRGISASSGVSVSLIHKIYDGRANNPTTDTIDKLVASLNAAARKSAA